MKHAPVVMFVYNRADHFERTAAALAENDGAKQTKLFIYCDAAKNAESEAAVGEVRQSARRIQSGGAFEEVRIIERDENMGLAKSVIAGVTEVIKEYGRAIVLEDDCVTAPSFLRFMNACLDRFEDDERIGSVAGFAPPIPFPADYDKDIFLAYRSCSWGWATWKDRWDTVDWDLNDLGELYARPELVKKLNANGTDRFIRLYRQVNSGGNSWSIRFGYHMVKNDMLTVYPRFSYIENIGVDGSGVHGKTGDDKKLVVDLSKAITDPVIEDVALDDRIQKTFKKYYSNGAVSDIKRACAAKMIILKEKRKKET